MRGVKCWTYNGSNCRCIYAFTPILHQFINWRSCIFVQISTEPTQQCSCIFVLNAPTLHYHGCILCIYFVFQPTNINLWQLYLCTYWYRPCLSPQLPPITLLPIYSNTSTNWNQAPTKYINKTIICNNSQSTTTTQLYWLWIVSSINGFSGPASLLQW